VETYPLLKACVVDARTTCPKWGILPDRKVEAQLAGLVRDVPVQDMQAPEMGDMGGSGGDVSRTIEGIINKELHDQQSIGISSNGFLWRVVRYHGETNSNLNPCKPAYIALTCNHVISDGRSGQALLGALLSDTPFETSGKKTPTIAPSMEATINCRPSLSFMLGQVWHEFIVPKLPRFLGNKFKKQPCWPCAPPVSRDPAGPKGESRYAFNHIQLSADVLKDLKDCGKSNDVKTLQPTLQIAAVAALWISALSNPTKRDASNDDLKKVPIQHGCTISYRQSTLGHPDLSGNYAGNPTSRTTCPGDGNLEFWQTVCQYATWLHAPATRHRGCELIGSLGFIPDCDNSSAEDPLRPTGWEIFLLEHAQRPPADSVNVSNLGFDALPPGSIRMGWSRTAIFTSPVHISIIGHEAGLDIDISRVKGAWIDETGYEPLAHFPAIYEKVLGVLAERCQGMDGTRGGTALMFGDLKRMVRGE
jgi:hypothetical protein